MKEKGFTLVELLAIIAILAIIAVITVPQIMNVIEDSRKNLTKDSAYGYKNAVHQYYLSESSNNEGFDLNGNYDITNGVLSDGLNLFNISPNGEVPKSGNITIEDGEIVDGCIDYGKYSISFENGNITETSSGGCYNVSYFTYDENAEAGENGKITSKLVSPNPSWLYYVKEYSYMNKYWYGIWDNQNEEFISYDYEKYFVSMEKCQEYLDSYYTDEEDIEIFECKQRENYKTYQICGTEDNKTYCLNIKGDSYSNNADILNDVYDDCHAASFPEDEHTKEVSACNSNTVLTFYDRNEDSASVYDSIFINVIGNCAVTDLSSNLYSVPRAICYDTGGITIFNEYGY